MSITQGRAFLLTATLALWAVEGVAEDRELEGVLREDAEPGAASTPAVPAKPTDEPRAAEEAAPPTRTSAAPRGRVIEEIVVTAQRTEEQLHDVPISMSAFDGRFLREQGVADLQDVARYVPNVRIDFAGPQIQPRLRGFGTNTEVTRGLEQPVGLAIDEVPYGRSDYFGSGLFDVDRVEVLRGPQGQLFGANTTVGLLNLTTKNPTDELTGSIDVERGELERQRIEVGVGGPLLPGFVSFRLAGLTEEMDGYVENTTARILEGADGILGGRDRRAVRAKLDFPDLLGGGLLLSYQRDEFDFGATPAEITVLPEKFHPLMRRYDPNVDLEPLNFVGSIDTPSFREVALDILVARGRYDLGDWGLNAVVGWSRLDSASQSDADFAPWPAIPLTLAEELSRQMTFELRATSPDLPGFLGFGSLFGLPLGWCDFTSGFFFQRREQSPTTTRIDVDGTLLLAIVALNNAPADDPLPPPPEGDGERPPPGAIETAISDFEQDSRRFAGFGQMNWHFADRWTLLYGMRLDFTSKDASWVQTVEPDSAVILPTAFDEFAGDDSRDELQFAPKVGMKFDWTEDVNFFGTWSSNFQAGGFNNFSAPDEPRLRRFEASRVRSWEGGTKMRLLGGAAELNLGLFWMTMKDFQLFTLAAEENELNLQEAGIVNVGELRARGVEADFIWLPTDWLTLRGALGFNDSEFVEFPIGTCFADRENTDGDEEPRCDLSGEPLEQAPKWDISVAPSVRMPFSSIPGLGGGLPALSEIDLTGGLAVQFVDTRFLNETLDPRTRQPSFFRLDANVGFGNESQGWSFRIRVENLTDEAIANLAREGSGAAGQAVKVVGPPRLIVGRFRWEF